MGVCLFCTWRHASDLFETHASQEGITMPNGKVQRVRSRSMLALVTESRITYAPTEPHQSGEAASPILRPQVGSCWYFG